MRAYKTIMPVGDKDNCYVCKVFCNTDARADELHHCISGSYRKLADEDKLIVPVCFYHHRQIHDKGWYDQFLKAQAEEYWCKTYGTSEDFLKRYGRHWNYDYSS